MPVGRVMFFTSFGVRFYVLVAVQAQLNRAVHGYALVWDVYILQSNPTFTIKIYTGLYDVYIDTYMRYPLKLW